MKVAGMSWILECSDLSVHAMVKHGTSHTVEALTVWCSTSDVNVSFCSDVEFASYGEVAGRPLKCLQILEANKWCLMFIRTFPG